MSFLSGECDHCQSKNHATEDCPHGPFETECAKCGGKEHATGNCPHGAFATECANCHDKEHSTEQCPQGAIFSSCGKCGATSHATEDCPHGAFELECAVCGSRDHATDRCPNGFGGNREPRSDNAYAPDTSVQHSDASKQESGASSQPSHGSGGSDGLSDDSPGRKDSPRERPRAAIVGAAIRFRFLLPCCVAAYLAWTYSGWPTVGAARVASTPAHESQPKVDAGSREPQPAIFGPLRGRWASVADGAIVEISAETFRRVVGNEVGAIANAPPVHAWVGVDANPTARFRGRNVFGGLPTMTNRAALIDELDKSAGCATSSGNDEDPDAPPCDPFAARAVLEKMNGDGYPVMWSLTSGENCPFVEYVAVGDELIEMGRCEDDLVMLPMRRLSDHAADHIGVR